MIMELKNGLKMPIIGLGVWRMEGKSIRDLILNAIKIGYRHFDCAGVGATASALDQDGVLEIDTTISLKPPGMLWKIWFQWIWFAVLESGEACQIETHPYFQRDSLVKFCQKHGICVTAHTPLGGAVANTEWFGSVSCLDDPVLKGLAQKYKKTVAQLVLRWGIQRNSVVIPKSSKLERLEENFHVFGFELTKEDMELIKGVDRKL
ncbi:hypothetical protein AQUCO_00400224v1 [Aquilegia coerulea]|uniref:NADP-dependent oxidoreductase domain-containing protein n=1 Tax=Aquilegia coerulea TaxID=218851 RepID=A0A2G5ETW7_AQUCA|nr:hypothetical protein AQUCO_00400224v1 [Aquilegia coerulea]